VSTRSSAETEARIQHWDYEIDVVCVGSGAAACSAAITAASQGASAILVEKLPVAGGTTSKSGGVAWIPNNHFLRERGIADSKTDCLRFLARLAFPQRYTPDSATLGLSESDYRLLEAFYDNAAPMMESLEREKVVAFQPFTMWSVNKLAPDYADHLPENKVPFGRAVEPAAGAGAVGGSALAAQLHKWLANHRIPVLLEHRVTKLVKDHETGRIIGIEAETDGKMVRIRAHKAVIFGTGGYAHNTELISYHQAGLYGSCAVSGSTGDFIDIATSAGARLGAMYTAWRCQVVLEEALENRFLPSGVYVLPGDSMILVNRFGRRIVNEKLNYNDRTQSHFTYDPVDKTYPNQVQFMIFDQRTLDASGGDFPIPIDPADYPYLISAETPAELASKVSERLRKIAPKTGGIALDSAWATTLTKTIARYNEFARTGKDLDFQRGVHAYDRDWHLLFSARRQGTRQEANTMPNVTMHPIASGPLYAIILGAGALDTNSGPAINEHAQVLDASDRPIPGLYGAGNCIASPARGAYYGAGGTIALALTYGYIAANHALKEIV
jgi:succinate dehydrogenase/fumarate reductase flavoprotein subunit